MRRRVALIGTGGTISSWGRHSLDLTDYELGGPTLQADELLAKVPEAAAAFDVIPARFRAVASTAIGIRDWLDLNALIERVAAEHKPDGFVITHGTATLEETAYFLNLVAKVEQPIVIVGAQRPPSGISSDAHINLLNAMRVAASEDARGLGVLVALNDEIQAARDVTKTAVYRLQAFQGREVGLLGYADPDGRVVIYRKPTRRHAPHTEFDVRGRIDLPPVEIVYSYAAASRAPIDALVADGVKAIVVASLAPGLLPPLQKAALQEAVQKGVPVVISCRAGAGRIVGTHAILSSGFIPADNLSPQKARILMALALATAVSPADIRRMFDEY